jgi:transcriptional regulator with XRE-family HTH domain
VEGKMQWILTDIPLGRNIQKVRTIRNLTQEETVARMQLRGSAMSRSTLANIETGRRNIKASDLKLLKLILDVAYDEFFQD